MFDCTSVCLRFSTPSLLLLALLCTPGIKMNGNSDIAKQVKMSNLVRNQSEKYYHKNHQYHIFHHNLA